VRIGFMKFRLIEPHGAPEPAEDLQIRERSADGLHDFGLGRQSQLKYGATMSSNSMKLAAGNT